MRSCFRKMMRARIILLMLSVGLVGCTSLGQHFAGKEYPLVEHTSANSSGRVRFLVIHFTTIDFQQSLDALTVANDNGVSSHYLIPERFDPSYGDKALKVYALVDEARRAWHAGPSRWEDRVNVNDQSIGIELVNQTRCVPADRELISEQFCFFREFDPQQVDLLIKLSKDILARHPDITPTRVVGHGDVQPAWKIDPGPQFPWQQLHQAGIGAWYDEPTVERYLLQFAQAAPSVLQTQQALQAYGYGLSPSGEMNAETVDVLRAFQSHFLSHEMTGQLSLPTQAVLFALLEKYFPAAAAQILAPAPVSTPAITPVTTPASTTSAVPTP